MCHVSRLLCSISVLRKETEVEGADFGTCSLEVVMSQLNKICQMEVASLLKLFRGNYLLPGLNNPPCLNTFSRVRNCQFSGISERHLHTKMNDYSPL